MEVKIFQDMFLEIYKKNYNLLWKFIKVFIKYNLYNLRKF
jgi:hypothetical protein